MRGQSFLAVDWGTTNRRVYRGGPDGAVEDTQRDDRGVLAIAAGGFEAEANALRARMGDLPMLCAGMVGSNRPMSPAPPVSRISPPRSIGSSRDARGSYRASSGTTRAEAT